MGRKKPAYEDLEQRVQELEDKLEQNVANHQDAIDEILEGEKRMYSLLQNTPDFIWTIDVDGRILSINKIIEGYKTEDIVGRNISDFAQPGYDTVFRECVKKVFQTRRKQKIESIGPGPDGKPGFYKHRIIPIIENRQMTGAMIISEDVTERKKAEDELKESEEKYRSLVENAAYAIVILDGVEILFVNQGALDITGCRSADEMTGRKFTDFVSPDYQDMMVKRGYQRQRGEDVPNQYEFKALRKDGTEFPAEISIGRIIYRGKEARQGIIRDISERRRAEEELKDSLDKLRKAMKGIVQAIAKITEIKDPYTAGHQRRVAKLACAIAEKMGLGVDRIEAVRLAGLIHDLGKIYIPPEILNKPTPLEDDEFTAIRAHARNGYDILKTTEFPWTITDIIHQHHERYDGSGYPQNLKGTDILVEARILAVADTVEAMSFERPYRAALGQECALEEIKANSGILYDPEVVDTCVTILEDNKFDFN